jgi:hypothetical protein
LKNEGGGGGRGVDAAGEDIDIVAVAQSLVDHDFDAVVSRILSVRAH